jgi:hypothetical protein
VNFIFPFAKEKRLSSGKDTKKVAAQKLRLGHSMKTKPLKIFVWKSHKF